MIILHVESIEDAKEAVNIIKKHKHVFVFVYMVGCGPCNMTRPEWAKMEQSMMQMYKSNDDFAVILINKDFVSYIKSIGQIDGFPTLKYISNHGKHVENYEDSSIRVKDRSSSSFINWIETKIKAVISATSGGKLITKLKNKTKKQRSSNKSILRKKTINRKKRHVKRVQWSI